MPISYAPTSWNPAVGCEPVSEGCQKCWAMKLHNQRHGGNITAATAYLDALPGGGLAQSATRRVSEARRLGAQLPMPPQYDLPFSHIQLFPDRLSQPLRWRKPRTVAVCFMGDLFHEEVPDEFIYRVFVAMGRAPKHRFLLLTKRPARMAAVVGWLEAERRRATENQTSFYGLDIVGCTWPLPNVWLGVTAENQRMADERIPLLLKTPAAHRWASIEPALGPVDLTLHLHTACDPNPNPACILPANLDWVVVGGESGPGHRPLQHSWVYDIRDQCKAAGVAFWGKQDSGSRPGIPLGGGLDLHEVPWTRLEAEADGPGS